MATHNEVGKEGEQIAKIFLEKKGMTILETNWRSRHLEIDIIATQNSYIHFIEVKTRTTLYCGYPEESISQKKIKNLINAAEEYLNESANWTRVQFDVIAINIFDGKPVIFYIEDVYDF